MLTDPQAISRPPTTESDGGHVGNNLRSDPNLDIAKGSTHEDLNYAESSLHAVPDSDVLASLLAETRHSTRGEGTHNSFSQDEQGTHKSDTTGTVLNEKAQLMVDQFEADRSRAKEALLLAQVFQRRAYNDGRLEIEFEEGDLVVLNPHTLQLLRSEKGRGKKLLMKYDGPFEIIRKLSPVTYQIRLPVSYGISPIINIAHLERYLRSPPEFGDDRPVKHLNRADFVEVPETEIDFIVAERFRKRGVRRIKEYKVRWKDHGPEFDEWKSRQALRNAPAILMDWDTKIERN
jgi:hypothetical protein